MLKDVAVVRNFRTSATLAVKSITQKQMEQVLFRASQLGKLMTDARTKTGLSETTKSALLEVYVQQKYKRYKEISNKYIEKGLAVENDAIDMWRRERKQIVFKNEQMFTNEFVKGTPDLMIKDDETDLVVNVPDIKSSWDVFTFHDAKANDLSKDYFWQGQAYMWLTGAPCATFCFVLVNAPLQMINDEKYKLARRMNLIDAQSDPTFLKKAQGIERSMIYDMKQFLNDYPDANLETDLSEWVYDIPVQERIHEKVVEFDADAIAKLQERVPMWREYLNTLAL
jgi:hypothetical protein